MLDGLANVNKIGPLRSARERTEEIADAVFHMFAGGKTGWTEDKH
jgi:hypothetical protein